MIGKKQTNIVAILILLFSLSALPVYAELKVTRTQPTDILIDYHQYSTVFNAKFLACEIPYLTSEKLLYFDIDIPFNYQIQSNIPTELRTEKYSGNTMLGIGAFFVVNRFGIGIKISFNPGKELSERSIRYDNGSVIEIANIREKKTKFNVDAWLGFRIFDNLGIGFDLYYRTYYKTFNLSREYLPGPPPASDDYWNIAEESLFLGPSVIYQPFGFMHISYGMRFVFKRRLESFIYEAQGFTHFDNLLKLTFLPIQDILFIYIHALFSHPLSANYDDLISTPNTYTREQTISTAVFIDWWFLSKKMYIRAGGFFDYINRFKPENGKRSLYKPYNKMFESVFGFQFGYGYKVNEKFLFTIDIIFRRHRYENRSTTSGEMEWFEKYNTWEVIFSTRYKL